MSRHRSAFFALVCLSALAGSQYFYAIIVDDLLTSIRFACATFLLCLTLHIFQRPGHPFSLATVYTGLLGIFHTGLFFNPALGGAFPTLSPIDSIWLNSGSLPMAAYTYSIAQLIFSAATFASALWSGTTTDPVVRTPKAIDPDEGPATAVGSVFLIGGLILWLGISLRRGVTIIGGSYTEFLDGTQNSSITYAYLMMGIGLPVLATTSGTTRKVLLRVFLFWSAGAFVLGLRGEVLIPLAAYLVVRARRRSIPIRPWMAPAAVGLLSLGALVRTTRVQGIRVAGLNFADLNPLSSLGELGYTIRPLAQVITWQSSGEPSVGPSTYLHPVVRALGGNVLGLGVPPASTDDTALNTVLAARVGNIGGSPIAEAVRAGSLSNVVLLMLILGVGVGIFDRRHGGRIFDIVVGGLAFVLFLWVRNTFTPVPFQVGLVLMTALVVRSIGASTGPLPAVRARPRDGIHSHRPKSPRNLFAVPGALPSKARGTAEFNLDSPDFSQVPAARIPAEPQMICPPGAVNAGHRGVGAARGLSWTGKPSGWRRGVDVLGPIVGVSSGAIINAGLALLFGVLTARTLGPAGQGELTVWITAASLCVLLLTLGTGAALRVRSRGIPDSSDCTAYVTFTLVAAVPAAAATVAVGLSIHQPSTTYVAFAAFLLGFCFMLGRQAADLLQAAGLTSTSVYSGALATGIQLMLFSVACITGHRTVVLALLCSSMGYASQAIFAARRTQQAGVRFNTGVRARKILSLVSLGAPTLGYSVGLLIVQRSDRIILAGLLGTKSAGVYAAAATLAEAIRLVPAAIGQLLFAKTAVLRKLTESTKQLYLVAVSLILVSCLVLFLASGPIVRTLFGEQYSESVPLLRGLVFAEVFMGVALLDSRILMGFAKTKEVGLISGLLVLVALPTYYVAIETAGVAGGVGGSIGLYAIYALVLRLRRQKSAKASDLRAPSLP